MSICKKSKGCLSLMNQDENAVLRNTKLNSSLTRIILVKSMMGHSIRINVVGQYAMAAHHHSQELV